VSGQLQLTLCILCIGDALFYDRTLRTLRQVTQLLPYCLLSSRFATAMLFSAALQPAAAAPGHAAVPSAAAAAVSCSCTAGWVDSTALQPLHRSYSCGGCWLAGSVVWPRLEAELPMPTGWYRG
jgi:hypothetical protein